VAFSDILAKQGVFCLPGSVVGMNGYLRASLTANDDMIERALPIFAAARNKVQETTKSDRG
jgi:aspartate aminotransferase